MSSTQGYDREGFAVRQSDGLTHQVPPHAATCGITSGPQTRTQRSAGGFGVNSREAVGR
jgi:hypothetical protein